MHSTDFFLIILFIFGCARSSPLHRLFSVHGERGLLLIALCGLLIAVDSLFVEHGLWGLQASEVAAHGLSSCGSRALEHKLNSCGAHA